MYVYVYSLSGHSSFNALLSDVLLRELVVQDDYMHMHTCATAAFLLQSSKQLLHLLPGG